MKMYRLKNEEKKEYKGQKTDYNIPTFGYISAFIFILISVITYVIVPYIYSFFLKDPIIISDISIGIIVGFTLAILQFYREKKKGSSKKYFIWVGSALAIICIAILLLKDLALIAI